MTVEEMSIGEKLDRMAQDRVALGAHVYVLETAFNLLAAQLARNTPDPPATIEAFIAELRRLVGHHADLQSAQASGLAFRVEGTVDRLAMGLRSLVPGSQSPDVN